MAFWDLRPTLADLAGAAPPEGLDGRSFRALLEGKRDVRLHDHLVWNRGSPVRVRGDGSGCSTLDTDRAERNDLAARYPALVAELIELLNRSITV